VLDRTADAETSAASAVENQNESQSAGIVEATARHGAGIGAWLARGWRFFITQSSSSLTRRIVVLNITGLVALSIGIIVLSQFRAGLIDARIQSLLVQGQIIAGAIASSATVETDSSITLDPDKLLNLHPGESATRPVRLRTTIRRVRLDELWVIKNCQPRASHAPMPAL
jgi:two-component system, OmpR family, sensor histidine kinase ChvG